MNAMGKRMTLAALLVVLLGLTLARSGALSTRPDPEPEPAYRQDQVFQAVLGGVRLGDAVPLDLSLSLRWRVQDVTAFASRFPDPGDYARLVLQPKAREVATRVANKYVNVATVFGAQREKFAEELRTSIATSLAEPGVSIQEVVLSEVGFPATFTRALEQTALKEHELEKVRQESFIALERAKSAQQQAEADGKTAIARAEAEGKLADIAARTEEKQRASALARAETEAQVIERKARAEAAKLKLLAQAEADKQRLIAEVEVEKQSKLKDVAVAKQRSEQEIEAQREKELASLCSGNPGYASFLVSKELASKVQIAVLPMGSEAGAIGNVLQTMMPAKSVERRQ
jgi:hypothetical protein